MFQNPGHGRGRARLDRQHLFGGGQDLLSHRRLPLRRDEIGDHRGRAAVRIARKRPVQVCPIQWRHPGRGGKCGRVQRWQQDHLPGQSVGIKRPGQTHHRGWSLELVPVGSAGDQHGRPRPPFQRDYRDRMIAQRVGIVRSHQKTYSLRWNSINPDLS